MAAARTTSTGGLAIIAAVADKFGHTVDASGQIVWAEVCWTAE